GPTVDVLGYIAFERGCELAVRPSGGCRGLLRSPSRFPSPCSPASAFSDVLRARCSLHHRQGTTSNAVDYGFDQFSSFADVPVGGVSSIGHSSRPLQRSR